MRTKPLGFSEKRTLTGLFVEMVRRHLPGDGWEYGASKFIKADSEAERILHVGVSDQKLELWVQVAMGMRFTEVEDMWRRSQNLDKSLGHWTVQGVISNFIRHAQLRYRIDHPKDVEFFEPKIRQLIDQACLPFWKRFATLTDVDRDWNTRSFEFERDATDALHHATRSLIVAKLAKNPDFDKIVTMRRAEVRRHLNVSLQGKALEEFDKLVVWLCSRAD